MLPVAVCCQYDNLVWLESAGKTLLVQLLAAVCCSQDDVVGQGWDCYDAPLFYGDGQCRTGPKRVYVLVMDQPPPAGKQLVELCIHLLKASGFLGGTSLIIVKTKDNCIWSSLMTAVFCSLTLCSTVQHPSPTAFSPVQDLACACGPFCATFQ